MLSLTGQVPTTVLSKENVIEINRVKLSILLQYEEGEELLYYHSLSKLLIFNITDFVVLTNKALYRVDNGKIKTNIKLNKVEKAIYCNNGIFRWDKITCLLSDNEKGSCFIYYGDTARFITEHINYLISPLCNK